MPAARSNAVDHNPQLNSGFDNEYKHICGVNFIILVLNVTLPRLRPKCFVSLHLHLSSSSRSTDQPADLGRRSNCASQA